MGQTREPSLIFVLAAAFLRACINQLSCILGGQRVCTTFVSVNHPVLLTNPACRSSAGLNYRSSSADLEERQTRRRWPRRVIGNGRCKIEFAGQCFGERDQFRHVFGRNVGRDDQYLRNYADLVAALDTVELKGTRGPPHPFFA
jgi:hypothetical protein